MFDPIELPIYLDRHIGLRWTTVANVCGRCQVRRSDHFVIGTLDSTVCPACNLVEPVGFGVQTEPFDWPERN